METSSRVRDMFERDDTPIHRELLEKYENLSFLRDDKGRWTPEVFKEGWYQNGEGKLYHYDGVVWDDVPSERIDELEYLG